MSRAAPAMSASRSPMGGPADAAGVAGAWGAVSVDEALPRRAAWFGRMFEASECASCHLYKG
jgi:hypothetical protein